MLRLRRSSSTESRTENKEATCADHNNSNTSAQTQGRQAATRQQTQGAEDTPLDTYFIVSTAQFGLIVTY